MDIITKVHLSFNKYSPLLGDEVRYSTKEVNGTKVGIAYDSYIVKVSDFHKINNCFSEVRNKV